MQTAFSKVFVVECQLKTYQLRLKAVILFCKCHANFFSFTLFIDNYIRGSMPPGVTMLQIFGKNTTENNETGRAYFGKQRKGLYMGRVVFNTIRNLRLGLLLMKLQLKNDLVTLEYLILQRGCLAVLVSVEARENQGFFQWHQEDCW